MNPIVKNILAVVGGALIGILVNSGIVSISGAVIPLPEGIDPNDFESLKANFHLFEPKNFIMPFLSMLSVLWWGRILLQNWQLHIT